MLGGLRSLLIVLFEAKFEARQEVGESDEVDGAVLVVSDRYLDQEVELFVTERVFAVPLLQLDPRACNLRLDVSDAVRVQRLKLLHDVADPDTLT